MKVNFRGVILSVVHDWAEKFINIKAYFELITMDILTREISIKFGHFFLLQEIVIFINL